MRVNFTISIRGSNDLPGCDYNLSAEVLCGQVIERSLESFTVYHGDWGDEVFPDHPERVMMYLLKKHRPYMDREALKAAEIEAQREERLA